MTTPPTPEALTMERIEELERLAKAATPGPWRSGRLDMRSYDGVTGEQFKNVYGPNFEPELHLGERIAIEVAKSVGEASLEDAAFIAAANPQTVLALLAAARRLVEAQDERDAMQWVLLWANVPGRHVWCGGTDSWHAVSENEHQHLYSEETVEELATKLGWSSTGKTE